MLAEAPDATEGGLQLFHGLLVICDGHLQLALSRCRCDHARLVLAGLRYLAPQGPVLC